ncbi:hypothetical protein ACEZDB_06095 [Streptacidiphilus sp. N1-3]|uniref:Aminoglycoside phosphotransferase domain-containing protein n=1 Tax=Streptacidiphilus alkalitolerans TaxID=3342712 RepID=A0ABV6WWE3_9ACTN
MKDKDSDVSDAPDVSGFSVFGDEAARVLEDWRVVNQRRLQVIQRIHGGGTGSVLATARLWDPARATRKVLLKLCSPDEGAAREAGGHTRAWRSRPVPFGAGSAFQYPEQHLVDQVYDPLPVGRSWLMFLQLALDRQGKAELVPLDQVVSRPERARVAATVVRSVLLDWNPDEEPVIGPGAGEFVRDVLGEHRLRGTGSLTGWVRRNLADPDATTIGLPGCSELLPNPYALGRHSSPLAGAVLPVAARGRAHGDLHPGNIMVPSGSARASEDFRLIDLSRFSETAPLARDPAHLLLCVVQDFLPQLLGDARSQLLALLTGTGQPGADDLLPGALTDAVHALLDAPTPWLTDRGSYSDWAPQHLLALQGCALMFVGRDGAGEQDNHWFFELAARACAAFLATHPGAAARAGAAEVLPPVTPPAAVPVEPTRHGPALAPLAAALDAMRPELRRRLGDCGDPGRDKWLKYTVASVANRCEALRRQAEQLLAEESDRADSADRGQAQSVAILAGEVVRTARVVSLLLTDGTPAAVPETARRNFTGALALLLDRTAELTSLLPEANG